MQATELCRNARQSRRHAAVSAFAKQVLWGALNMLELERRAFLGSQFTNEPEASKPEFLIGVLEGPHRDLMRTVRLVRTLVKLI
jgi:hypothetical protein